MNIFKKEDVEMSILASLVCSIAVCVCAYQISISDFGNNFKLVSGIFGLPFLYVVSQNFIYQIFRKF